jgi:DNA-binding LytR/AlgR family response regulator
VRKKINQLFDLLNEQLGLFFSVSIGVFLFVLFFQPFPLDRFDFNNKLLFVSGLGTIVFLFMFLIRVAIPWIIQFSHQSNIEQSFPAYLGGFAILSLNSIAFAFYLHYVGWVAITFYIMFKVVLVCLAPVFALRLYDVIDELKHQNDSLIIEKKIIQRQIELYEQDYLNKSVEFISETSSENISLLIADVVFFRSADNYVEIAFKEGDTFRKKLIRNTLKSIEQQIKFYTNFIRCHRICIVNIHFIEKLNSNYSNHWLSLKGFNEQIPVSRQYLLKLKESL